MIKHSSIHFTQKNIIKALQLQSRIVLLVDAAGTLSNSEADHYINLSAEENLKLTAQDIRNLIQKK